MHFMRALKDVVKRSHVKNACMGGREIHCVKNSVKTIVGGGPEEETYSVKNSRVKNARSKK